MLVISRKAGESFILSDNIRISILSVGSEKVSVGIDAPPEIKIVRTELAETIQANRDSIAGIDEVNRKGIASLLKDLKK